LSHLLLYKLIENKIKYIKVKVMVMIMGHDGRLSSVLGDGRMAKILRAEEDGSMPHISI
jgi:hypothetical protein